MPKSASCVRWPLIALLGVTAVACSSKEQTTAETRAAGADGSPLEGGSLDSAADARGHTEPPIVTPDASLTVRSTIERDPPLGVTIGAVRWDGWYQRSQMVQQTFVDQQPALWARLPFFTISDANGTITGTNGDSQEVMDQEIMAAANGASTTGRSLPGIWGSSIRAIQTAPSTGPTGTS